MVDLGEAGMLDSVDSRIRSAYLAAIAGEFEPEKLDRIIDIIESPEDRRKRLRIKQLRQGERLVESQVRALLDEAAAKQSNDGEASMVALKRALELDPNNTQVNQFVKDLRKKYTIGQSKEAVNVAVRAGQTSTRQTSLNYPDSTISVVVKVSLDANVKTWQGYQRYSSSDVRKTYGSNAGRLRASIIVNGNTVWQEQFKGEEIAYLGRNWTVWEKPHFNTPSRKTGSVEYKKFKFRYQIGSSGSRRTDQPNSYPSGTIESAYMTIECIRDEL